MLDSKPVHSLLVLGIDFSKIINKPLDENFIRFYQSYIETHMWAYFCIRPDLCFAVFILSQFLSNLTIKYMIAVQRVNQYLQAIKDLKIVYYKGFTQYSCLEVYIDVD